MKKILLITLLAACAAPAFADEPNMLMGCEIVPAEGGGYYFKADPECVFTVDANTGRDDREIKDEDEEEGGGEEPKA